MSSADQYVEDWIGAQLGDYVIHDLVGEGSFSFVFRGVDRFNQSERALKVPRPNSLNKAGGAGEEVPTQVFVHRDKRFVPQEVSPVQLLKLQVLRTRTITDQGIVRIEDYSFDAERSYARMPLCSGPTLRAYMKGGPVPVAVLRNIALTLSRLNRLEEFGYHGDVKPENMIVTKSGVIMVDCGYFGAVESESSDERRALIVTTPRYYPLLKADDLLAFGLLLWEIALRKPLLNTVTYSQDCDLKSASDELVRLVTDQEALGNFHFSQVLEAKRPSELREGIPEEEEELLLSAVRLGFDDAGKLDLVEGFESFDELADALKALSQLGIHYL